MCEIQNMIMKKNIFIVIFLVSVILTSECSAFDLTKLIPGGVDFCEVDTGSGTLPTLVSNAGFVDYLNYTLDLLKWLNDTKLMLCFIVPILGVFFITYGFLETIRIFKITWVNVAIAILIGLSFTALGIINWVIGVLFQVMGGWAVGIFAAMFFAGTYLLYLRRKAEWGTQSSIASAFEKESEMLNEQVEKKREEYAKLMHDLATANIIARAGIRRRMKKIDKEVRDLTGRLKELKEAYET